MGRPKRALIPKGAVDIGTYWTEKDDPAPGDGWVCMSDGGWHSTRLDTCGPHCICGTVELGGRDG